jgi:uncharacterized protein (TIGR02147 family)
MMSGKRSITAKTIKKFSQKLDLSPFEKKQWMSSSVQEEQTSIEKKTLQLQEDQFRMISDWYHFAILAMTRLKNTQSDPRWVARELGIDVQDAHQALLRLVRLEILETKPKLKQISDPIEVTSDIPSEAIRKYHKQNLNLAAEKIETIPNSLREYQSVSLTLNPNQMKAYKKLIDDFMEQASEMQNNDKNQVIYNLNVQLFPVSKINQPATQETP